MWEEKNEIRLLEKILDEQIEQTKILRQISKTIEAANAPPPLVQGNLVLGTPVSQ